MAVKDHKYYQYGGGYCIRNAKKEDGTPTTRRRTFDVLEDAGIAVPPGMEVDHINRDRGDDRLENLRICTRSQNAANRRLQSNNTSGFRGVYKEGKKWRAGITVNGEIRRCGLFSDAIDAARAYDAAARAAFGEFATTNFET